jgi:uncharacterized protein (TIGR00375 family)
MEIPTMTAWAQRKGIDLLGTGDFTHPAWLEHLQRELAPAGGGLYARGEQLYVLSAEVALVWRHDGVGRRLHMILLVPSFEDARRAAEILARFGTISSNGRPMLSVAPETLLDGLWDAVPQMEVIPAHIWTPWYSLFGSKSGFDEISACFGHHTPHLHAVETGLSSDPAMNERVSALDRLTLISCSDAHSPAKLGRELTVFELAERSYQGLLDALCGQRGGRVVETIEVPPELGKYHYDGHRSCGVVLAPDRARALGNRCPVCGKPLTLGVLHRLEALADRAPGDGRPKQRPRFRTLLPLAELVSAIVSTAPGSRRVEAHVERLAGRYGSELRLLLEVPIEALRCDPLAGLAPAIAALRDGRLRVSPGYDGVYGRVERSGLTSGEGA